MGLSQKCDSPIDFRKDQFPLTVFLQIIVALVRALQIMMFARAILSWIPQLSDSTVSKFLIMMTEPIIAPVRAILNNFESVRSMPIDISFLVTLLILSFIV